MSIAMPMMTKSQATALAQVIRGIREDWDYPGIMAALGKLRGDLGPAAIIAIQCALDPSANTPAAMVNGTYTLDWNPGGAPKPTLPKQPPVEAVLSTLTPHPDPAESHRGYLAAIKALQEAKAK